tara:strand:+ start:216 stop:416 length:201 start_codon:yes stop_codon:yes gene_type:complete
MRKIRLDSVDSNEFLLSRNITTPKYKTSKTTKLKPEKRVSNAYSTANLTARQRDRRRRYKLRKGDV